MNVLIVLAAVSTLCLADPKISSAIEEEIIKELLNDYKQKHDDSIEPFCVDTGLKCHRCAECHDNLQFGLCITGAVASKCLCNWGWTGPHAQRVIAPNDVSAYSRNRIRADDCKTPCHYTHDFWNKTCLDTSGGPNCIEYVCKQQHGGYAKCINDVCVPDCNPVECAKKYGECKYGKCVPRCNPVECAAKGGKCFQGVCKIKCCRATSGPNPVYVPAEDTYYADTCSTSCPYLGTGVPNPGCMKQPPLPPPCDPRCAASAGTCNTETGKCTCCRDFTGSNPVYDPVTQSISADVCDTYCPYVLGGKPNALCINPNYISRCTVKISYG